MNTPTRKMKLMEVTNPRPAQRDDETCSCIIVNIVAENAS
jgi:hypothetical protein